jgi:hypothetical protein
MVSRIALFVLTIALIITSASAYEVIISAPTALPAGVPLVVNGTTDLPAGNSLDIIFSREYFGSEQVAKEVVIVQGEKKFTVNFDTKGLERGQYKVEVAPLGNYLYLGDSVTLRPVTIIDRSDEIVLDPPLKKIQDGTLVISGTDPELKNAAVRVTVADPDGQVIFGPEYVITNTFGAFLRILSIEKAGEYPVSFSDERGTIVNVSYHILPKPVAEMVIPAVNPSPVLVSSSAVSASFPASRDDPAVFAVVANPGTVRVSTSSGTDWVMEYLGTDGTVRRVNEAGTIDPEIITFVSGGDISWFRVYPYKYEEKGNVTLFAENALAVTPDKSGGSRFVSMDTKVPAGIRTSPLPWWIAAGAIGTGIAVLWKRRLN